MAKRGRQTFKKRQKEMQRKQKKEAKAERIAQRKTPKEDGEEEATDTSEFASLADIVGDLTSPEPESKEQNDQEL